MKDNERAIGEGEGDMERERESIMDQYLARNENKIVHS